MKWITLTSAWICIFFVALSHDKIETAIYMVGSYIMLGISFLLHKLSKNDSTPKP